MTDKDYWLYGRRGIRVCQEWMSDPGSFEAWALENGYNSHLTIDRVDPSRDYEPSNCRWVTVKDNSKYKSTTNLLEVNGVYKTGKEWARMLGIGENTINKYLRLYPERLVKEFIVRRMDNPTAYRHNESWMKVYGLS